MVCIHEHQHGRLDSLMDCRAEMVHGREYLVPVRFRRSLRTDHEGTVMPPPTANHKSTTLACRMIKEHASE